MNPLRICKHLLSLVVKELTTFYRSEYDENEHFVEECDVAEEFTSNMFQPSPDGDYIFKLHDPSQMVPLDNLDKLIIEISGSLIPFENKKNHILPTIKIVH